MYSDPFMTVIRSGCRFQARKQRDQERSCRDRQAHRNIMKFPGNSLPTKALIRVFCFNRRPPLDTEQQVTDISPFASLLPFLLLQLQASRFSVGRCGSELLTTLTTVFEISIKLIVGLFTGGPIRLCHYQPALCISYGRVFEQYTTERRPLNCAVH